jgi:hypothetical protein
MFFFALQVTGQEVQKQKEWIGKLRDGTVITKEELGNILKEHKKWIETEKFEGKRADFSEADLSGAELSKANLSGAFLIRAHLSEANLNGANLIKTNLSGAYLIETYLSEADLSGAYLIGANLVRAEMSKTNLHGAYLSEADLSEADLSWAYLIGTYLNGADLKKADLYKADLRGAFFEPKQESILDIKNICYAQNLSELIYTGNPKALIMLREEFKKSGLRRQEREVTRAIQHKKMLNYWKENRTFKKIEAVFYYTFFELTCQYGMKPGRPLIILIGLIPFFSFIYIFALKSKRPKTGLWLIFLKDRVLKATKKERPFKLTANFPPKAWPIDWPLGLILIIRLYRMMRISLHFSLLSATTIGWRDFNLGNWISRLQRREYTLRATGWVRTLSGIQSLISVYLLALWVLTYFGRPFEAI